jgi:hypothetical protein
MRAFTTFHVQLYPIQHAEGVEKAVEKRITFHISKKMEFLGAIPDKLTQYMILSSFLYLSIGGSSSPCQ